VGWPHQATRLCPPAAARLAARPYAPALLTAALAPLLARSPALPRTLGRWRRLWWRACLTPAWWLRRAWQVRSERHNLCSRPACLLWCPSLAVIRTNSRGRIPPAALLCLRAASCATGHWSSSFWCAPSGRRWQTAVAAAPFLVVLIQIAQPALPPPHRASSTPTPIPAAGPGFINIRVSSDWLASHLTT
jgi:hypothetical protein